MTALLVKDLRLLRPWWWLIVPGHVLFAANGIFSPQAFFALNVALALTYTVVLMIVEWKQDAERFLGSLPVSRRDVVRARYAGALGAAMGGTVLYALYGTVLLHFGTERLVTRWPTTPGWETVHGLAAFFLTVWVVSLAYLPFYFLAGLARGTWLFVGVVAPLVVGWMLLGPRMPRLEPLDALAGGLSVAVASLVAAAVLGGASLRLSERFYERRDL